MVGPKFLRPACHQQTEKPVFRDGVIEGSLFEKKCEERHAQCEHVGLEGVVLVIGLLETRMYFRCHVTPPRALVAADRHYFSFLVAECCETEVSEFNSGGRAFLEDEYVFQL